MAATGWMVRGASLMVSTAGLIALSAPAYAQPEPTSPASEAQDSGVGATKTDSGDIVVVATRYVPSGAITASKTTAPLIETPQSVSVISRDQIDLLNFIDVQQAVRYTAGIVGENYGPDLRFDFLTLRGFIPPQYIDGLQAPVSSTISNVGVDLYGFEAIDILKGPSGALYGSTPPGGIYNLTSRRPSATFGGEIQAKYGTDDFKQVAGTVTGEAIDGLGLRLTGLYRDRGSQTEFVNAKRAYVAPAATLEIGPDTKITALSYYQYDKVKGDTNGFLPAVGVLFPNPVGTVRRDINLGEPNYNFYRRNQWAAGYELTHLFSSALRFTQNLRFTGYHEYQQIIYGGGGLGADNRTVGRFNFPFKEDVSQFAVDSRLDAKVGTGPVDHGILLGLDYRNYRDRSAFAFGLATPIDLFNPIYSTTPIAVPALTPFTNQKLRQIGLYLQDQAKIGNFILTVSGRQDWVTIDNVASSSTARQNKFTYRVGGTYVTESGVGPYVSYATSFQPVIGQTRAGAAFQPTSGNQIEAGVKFDGRRMGEDLKIFATAAIYRIRQSNILATDPANAAFQVQTGEVEAKGVELEVVTRLHKQLSINGSYTYIDAKVTKTTATAAAGARLEAQPQHKASLFADYTLAKGAFAGAGAGVGIRYLSDSPGVTGSTLYITPATTLFDAALHYDIPGWRFAVNGSNLFDKRYAGRCTGPAGCFFGQSRQIIATAIKRF